MEQMIFPNINSPPPATGFTLSRGAHRFEFEISFPLMTSCRASDDEIRHLITVSPPTLESYPKGQYGTGITEYMLKAHVKRPGKLHRDSSAERKLIFRPPNPSLTSISTGLRDCVVSATLRLDHTVPGQPHPSSPTNVNDTGGPVLLLEARLPSPAVLYTGESVALRLVVRKFPTASDDLSLVKLQSITVRLISTTRIKIRQYKATWDTKISLLNKSGLQAMVDTYHQGNGESFEISDSLLGGIIIPRETCPSFTACTIQQDHALEVITGFSIGQDGKANVNFNHQL